MDASEVGSWDASQAAREAADFVRRRWAGQPRVGVVLGTGAGAWAETIDLEHVFEYSSLPHLPRSTALGHRGRLLCGRLNGCSVVAMQGRFHLYEGYSVSQATLGICLMKELGCGVILISNAAGGIRPGMASGDLMVIDSHINLMFRRGGTLGSWGPAGLRPLRRADVAYEPELIEEAHRLARRGNFVLHQGTYVALCGPNYETRAEYRFLRAIGGSCVGMSTVPEVELAGALGLRVLAVSIVANVAQPDRLAATSGAEVIEFAAAAGPHLAALFSGIIQFAAG